MNYKFEIEEEEFKKLQKSTLIEALGILFFFIASPLIIGFLCFGSTLLEDSFEGEICRIVVLSLLLFCELCAFVLCSGTVVLFRIKVLQNSKIIQEEADP